MAETGWITEPGWRFTDWGAWWTHVCKRNAPPIPAICYCDTGIICPECGAYLSLLEQIQMVGGLDIILRGHLSREQQRRQEFLDLVLEATETGNRTKLAEWWRVHFPGYKWWLLRPRFPFVLPDDGRIEP